MLPKSSKIHRCRRNFLIWAHQSEHGKYWGGWTWQCDQEAADTYIAQELAWHVSWHVPCGAEKLWSLVIISNILVMKDDLGKREEEKKGQYYMNWIFIYVLHLYHIDNFNNSLLPVTYFYVKGLNYIVTTGSCFLGLKVCYCCCFLTAVLKLTRDKNKNLKKTKKTLSSLLRMYLEIVQQHGKVWYMYLGLTARVWEKFHKVSPHECY